MALELLFQSSKRTTQEYGGNNHGLDILHHWNSNGPGRSLFLHRIWKESKASSSHEN